MSEIFDIIGIKPEDAVAKSETVEQEMQGGSYKQIEPGVYELEIEKLYLVENDTTGSVMGYIDFTVVDKDNPLGGATFKYGDWHKSGKTGLLGFEGQHGFVDSPFVKMLSLLSKYLNITDYKPIKTKVDHYGNQVEAVVLQAFEGKKICAGVQIKKDGEYEKPIVTPFKCDDAEAKERVAKKVERKPVIEVKQKEEQAPKTKEDIQI